MERHATVATLVAEGAHLRKRFKQITNYYSMICKERSEHPQKVNIWAGMFGNAIISPLFFEEHLTGNLYLDKLEEKRRNTDEIFERGLQSYKLTLNSM